MNIGIVTTWFERGAAYVSKQFRDALKEKHNVYVYARGGESYAKNDPNWDHPYVYWSKRYRMPNSTYINRREFRRWIDEYSIELIIFNEQTWYEAVRVAREAGVKTVAYVDYYRANSIKLFDIYDSLICNTKRHASVFDWHSGMSMVNWGTNISIFKPKIRKQVDKLIFFHSCGHAPFRKGADLLIRAFSQSTMLRKNSKLIIHSQVSIDTFTPDIAQLINEMKDEDSLQIVCDTVAAPGLYFLGDVYVYPARLDGLGLTVAEAISCGLPTIVPDNAPMNEFTSDVCKTVKIEKYYCREDGYYWPIGEVSVVDLRLAMESYLESDIDTFSLAAREHAIKHLNWDVSCKGLVAAIENCKVRKCKDETLIATKISDYGKYPMIEVFPIFWELLYKLLLKRLSKI